MVNKCSSGAPKGWCWVVGGWGGAVCKVIFMSNPTTVLRLCCVVVGVVTKTENEKYPQKSFYDLSLLIADRNRSLQNKINSLQNNQSVNKTPVVIWAHSFLANKILYFLSPEIELEYIEFLSTDIISCWHLKPISDIVTIIFWQQKIFILLLMISF